ncbi:MAG: RNA methyltransferase, partial [Eubacterium sp.]|nr:RNA methyltransferase [Candidatus Colimonas fimequi]
DKQSFSAEPETRVTLFQGVPKGSKFETIVQKTVELGVDTIQPVFMARTVVVDKGNYSKKVQRLNKIAAEAVKQCKRGVIPQVEEPIKMMQMLEDLEDFDLVLFPYENEKGTTIKDELRGVAQAQANGEMAAGLRVAVIIGPEGGFSDEEASDIVEAGGLSVSLGRTTLRTETAGMAALAMIMYELEL